MPKPDLAVLLGVPKGAKKDDAGEDEGFARDILDAIKDDDAEAFAMALKGFVRECKYEDDEAEEE